MAPNTVLQVYIFREGEFIGTDVFMEQEIVVGRDPDSVDLYLDSTEVSRQHARIVVGDGTITIEDLRSTNGDGASSIVAGEEEEAEIVYLEAAKGTKYKTIDRVLKTAAAAGFTKFRLAVNRRS